MSLRQIIARSPAQLKAIASKTNSFSLCLVRPFSHSAVFYNAPVDPPASLNAGEKHIYSKLIEKFTPTKLVVEDISGGCGSMYQVEVASAAFRKLSMVKQHRMVNDALKEEIKGMHGIRLNTSADQ